MNSKTIAAILAIIILAFSGYVWHNESSDIMYPGSPGDSWCDTDFAKRIDVNVNNTAGSTLADYQVYINLSSNPINETSLRVYNATSCTLRAHWCENITSGNCYALWINYSGITASSWTNDTAIYHDNAVASSTSSGYETFIAFDDIEQRDNVTQVDAWTVSNLRAWQGITTDDDNYYYSFSNCWSGTNDKQTITKWFKSNQTVASDNQSAGTVHMSSGAWLNATGTPMLYVTDISNHDVTCPDPQGKIWEFYPGNLTGNGISHSVSCWAEGIDFYDDHFWVVCHDQNKIHKFDSSWNCIGNYTLPGHGGAACHEGYDGVVFFEEDINSYCYLAVHHNVGGGPALYKVKVDGNTFTKLKEIDADGGGTDCSQGIDLIYNNGSRIICSDRDGTHQISIKDLVIGDLTPLFECYGDERTTQARSLTHSIGDTTTNYFYVSESVGQQSFDSVVMDSYVYLTTDANRIITYMISDNTHSACAVNPIVDSNCGAYLKMENALIYYHSGAWTSTGISYSTGWYKFSILQGSTAFNITVTRYDNGTTQTANTCGNWQVGSAITNIDKFIIKQHLDSPNVYWDDFVVRKCTSPEPASTLGSEEDRPATNPITITSGNRALFCNWTADATFTNIATNLTNSSDFFWYNSTSQQWIFYNTNRTINANTVIPEHAAIFVCFNATTTVDCEVLAVETITIPANVYYYTALRESAAKTLSQINTSVTSDGCAITDIYAWNSTAGAYTDTDSYSVLPNEGLAIYATTGCSWDGAV